MPLESVTHISDLVVTNPTSTDPKSEGDNHLRNIKIALKTDFPNISGPVTKTHTQLNNALDKTGDTMTGALNLPSNGLAVGTNQLVVSGGNMGVGTNTPADSVEVIGAGLVLRTGKAASTAATLRIYGGAFTGNKTTLAVISGTSGNNDLILGGGTAGGEPATTVAINIGAAGANGAGTQAVIVDSNRNVLVTGSGGLGYGVGSGGTVGQVTNRNTGVALNKPSGQITLVSGTTTAGTFNSFTLTNSSIAATDGVEVCFTSGATANSYGLLVTAIAAGSCRIQIHNIAAVGVAEAPVIQFRVIKGATS